MSRKKLGPEHRAAYLQSWYQKNRARILAKQSTPEALARRRELDKTRSSRLNPAIVFDSSAKAQ